MMLFLPELTLLVAGLILFLVGLTPMNTHRIRIVSLFFATLLLLSCGLSIGQKGDLFAASFQVDAFSQTFKMILAIGFWLFLFFTSKLPSVAKRYHAEYYLFLFMSVLGLMILISSVELLAIFIALELSSFTLYIMVPMRDEGGAFKFQMEAGAKYLIFGIMATGFLLFGMSYLFGLTGTTYLKSLAIELPNYFTQPAATVAITMVLAGFFYKLGLFPFHFWVPDVYEGAANETTSFIATLPKLAAAALLIRIIILATPEGELIIKVLMVCAVLSMFYGNLSALVQTDLKRMLGFSGIAHAGFVLLGLLIFQSTGYAHSFYYIVGYVFMNLACFLVICTVAQQGENLDIASLSGLYKRSPLLAVTLLIGLFALAGIPPFVGFMGKFILLLDILQKGYLFLVILAAVNTAIAIYYYLSVVRVAFCSDEGKRPSLKITPTVRLIAILLIIIITGMGVWPSLFISYAHKTIQSLM